MRRASNKTLSQVANCCYVIKRRLSEVKGDCMLKLQAEKAEVCIFPREMTFFTDAYLKKTSFLWDEKNCRNTFYWKSNNANIRICTKYRKNNSLRPSNRILPGYWRRVKTYASIKGSHSEPSDLFTFGTWFGNEKFNDDICRRHIK